MLTIGKHYAGTFACMHEDNLPAVFKSIATLNMTEVERDPDKNPTSTL